MKSPDLTLGFAPVDRAAAGAIFGTDEDATWSPGGPLQERIFKDLPPTAPVPIDAPDLRGLKVDRLIVVGLSPKDPSVRKKAPAKWVCRCVCGNYVLRSAKAVREYRAAEGMRCGECAKVRTIRHHGAG